METRGKVAMSRDADNNAAVYGQPLETMLCDITGMFRMCLDVIVFYRICLDELGFHCVS